MFVDYGSLATQLYEFTKPIGHSIDGDIEFYFEQLKDTKGCILEAGVGTGRILIPFIKEGLLVDGVDISAEMLTKCRENCTKHQIIVALYLQNLEHLKLLHPYEAIIMPTGSFNLLATRAAMSATLTAFKNHLQENGRVIIDIAFPIDFKEGEETTELFALTQTTSILFKKQALKLDWANQTTTEILTYEKWEDGQLTQFEQSKFILAWYGIEEFKMILTNHGFSQIDYVWDYAKNTNAYQIATFFAQP